MNNLTQVFMLNIPAAYCVNDYNPSLSVTCKVERLDSGKQGFLHFIDVQTITMCLVKDWLGVHNLAVERADVLWKTPITVHERQPVSVSNENNSQSSYENSLHEAHAVAVTNNLR